MSLCLDIYKISQSRWFSVLTSKEIFSLDESWSPQIFRYKSPTKFTGLVIYSLDNFCFSLNVFLVLVFVSILRLRPSVLVSVLSMRLRHFQSRSRWSKSGLADPCYRSGLVYLVSLGLQTNICGRSIVKGGCWVDPHSCDHKAISAHAKLELRLGLSMT